MCCLSGDHAVSTKHLNVFCSRRRISDEADVEEWVACDRRNENIPLAWSTTISPTSTTPERAASCTFPCLRRNGLAKCFFSTRAKRSRLILSSESVGSDGSRSTISMPGSCSSVCSWRECSKLLIYAYLNSLLVTIKTISIRTFRIRISEIKLLNYTLAIRANQ